MPLSENNSNQARSDEKLGEMLLHIAQKSANDPKFGAVKLNKLVFFSDCVSFIQTGKTITGSKFMRLGKGPVPKRLVPVREKLIAEKRAAVQKKPLVSGWEQHRLVALDSPRLDSLFTAGEITLVDSIIEELKNHTADEISDLSHAMPAWNIANDKEEIPIESAFILSLVPSPQDEVRALELAETHGL
jgi:uncharacterized phage-associated protein